MGEVCSTLPTIFDLERLQINKNASKGEIKTLDGNQPRIGSKPKCISKECMVNIQKAFLPCNSMIKEFGQCDKCSQYLPNVNTNSDVRERRSTSSNLSRGFGQIFKYEHDWRLTCPNVKWVWFCRRIEARSPLPACPFKLFIRIVYMNTRALCWNNFNVLSVTRVWKTTSLVVLKPW